MDLIQAGKFYIDLMLNDAGSGMKAMLFDNHTIKIMSVLYSQSQMFQKEVFLFSQLKTSSSELLPFIPAIVFVQPTEENLSAIIKELEHPRFSSYFIYFSYYCPRVYIEQIAKADDDERVNCIKEICLDYYILGNKLFTFDVKNDRPNWGLGDETCTHLCNKLSAVVNSLGIHPEIKYQASSLSCEKLGVELKNLLEIQGDYRGQNDSLLLLVDRTIDPVVPVLNSWTYEAMIHEIIGIDNCKVKFSTEGYPETTMLLNAANTFYHENRLHYYDEIVEKISANIGKVREIREEISQAGTISNMKGLVEKYPQQRKWLSMITQHCDLVGELTKLATERSLFDVSLLEQDIVTYNLDFHQTIQRIATLFQENPEITALDAIGLAVLCLIKFPECANYKLEIFNKHLLKLNVPRHIYQIPQDFQRIVQSKPAKNASISKGFVSWWRNTIKNTTMGGSTNMYKRYRPYLVSILEEIARNSLSIIDFPSTIVFNPFSLGNNCSMSHGSRGYSKVVVFVVGGFTYAEAAAVEMMDLPFSVVLGGTMVHNFETYSAEISRMAKK